MADSFPRGKTAIAGLATHGIGEMPGPQIGLGRLGDQVLALIFGDQQVGELLEPRQCFT